MNRGSGNEQFGTVVQQHKVRRAPLQRCVLAIGAIAGLLVCADARAADLSLPVTGNLLGSVLDAAGAPQLGATVQLFNKYERLVAKTTTALDGRFAFAGLPADFYSVRVSLASFLPASRDRIAIKGGLDSVLQIHLATLFSSVELSYGLPSGAMTNDWKWVLRSSPATRPITRLMPVEPSQSPDAQMRPQVFSGTHAMLSLSGGDGGLMDFDAAQADVGTEFALSTNVLGKNQVQLGGTFGQNAGLGPAAMGICAIYSRNADGGFGEPPEVALTVSQLGRMGPQLPGQQNAGSGTALGNAQPIRTMSLSLYEVTDPVDGVHIEYGMTAESVDYLQHTSRISPFARMTIDLDKADQVVLAYSDGGRPDELAAHQQYEAAELDAHDHGDDLIDTVNTLARMPQLSTRDGRLELQRTQNYEIGYKRTSGSRTFAVSAFHESVSNGRINVAGNVSALEQGDLLSDGTSITSTYNVGNYRRQGYLASVNQRVNDSLDFALAYGRMAGFTPDSAGLSEGWGTQEKFLEEKGHNVASANLQARVRGSGTKVLASYGWVDAGAVIPRHVFTTQNAYVAPGLNIEVRQPLPSLFGIPGRLELTADLRNLLAQGYLPFDTGGGQKLVIVQAPRAIRGGLNFIF